MLWTAGESQTRWSNNKTIRFIRNKYVGGEWLNAIRFLRFNVPKIITHNLMNRSIKKRFYADQADEDPIFAFMNEMNQTAYKFHGNFGFIYCWFTWMWFWCHWPGLVVVENVIGYTWLSTLNDKLKSSYIQAVFEIQRCHHILAAIRPQNIYFVCCYYW